VTDAATNHTSIGTDAVEAPDIKSERRSPFTWLHPVGWTALVFLFLAVIATAVGADLLIGRMPWWMWLSAIAVVAAATSDSLLNGIRLGIEAVSTFTGKLAMILAWFIFFVQLFNVITRYSNNWFETDILFGQTVSLAWMSFGMLFLLGVNYGVKEGINPRIDFWWADFSNMRKAWLDFIMHTFFFLPFLLLGIRVLKPYAAASLGYNRFANDGQGEWPSGWRVWETWEQSINAGELPVGPIQAFMFIGFILWASQVFAEIIKTGFVIAGRDDLGDIAASDVPLRVE
jgi:TRAP-type mannitol/chloroaromatic compound transport system permease small subunit